MAYPSSVAHYSLVPMKKYSHPSLLLLGAFALASLLALHSEIGIACAVASVIAFLIDRTIALAVLCLNRLSRRCRESLLRDLNSAHRSSGSEDRVGQLNETFARLQRREQQLSIAYATRRCSEADVLIAASMRLEAEIALLRHEHMPKPWHGQ